MTCRICPRDILPTRYSGSFLVDQSSHLLLAVICVTSGRFADILTSVNLNTIVSSMPTGSRPAKYEHNTLGSGSGTQSPFPRDDKTMDIDQPNDASSLVVDVLQRVGEICLMDGQHRSMINLALGCKRLKERLTMVSPLSSGLVAFSVVRLSHPSSLVFHHLQEIEEGEGLYSVMWDYELQHYTPAQMKLAR